MKSICVFCGSKSGSRPLYLKQAQEVGEFISQKNLRLVYGGASIGIMGAVADSVLKTGGKTLGVIPFFIKEMEVAHLGLDEMIEVHSMHERKQVMYDESDYFLALPGGIGTLDELCEISTWQQLGLHKKPIFIFNQSGFFNAFIKHLDFCQEEGFLSKEDRGLFLEIKDLGELARKL